MTFGNNDSKFAVQREFWACGNVHYAPYMPESGIAENPTLRKGMFGYYWTTTESDSDNAYFLYIGTKYANAASGTDKATGKSVRLFRDN